MFLEEEYNLISDYVVGQREDINGKCSLCVENGQFDTCMHKTRHYSSNMSLVSFMANLKVEY